MKKLLILCAGIATLAACKKKDDNKSRTEYLTSGKWFISSYYYYDKITDANGTVTDLTDTTEYPTEACEKDNFITFKADGTLTSDEGATKCDTSDDQTSTGTWAFVENESKISITSDGDTYLYKIQSLNGSNFIFGQDSSYTTNGYKYEYKYTITLKH